MHKICSNCDHARLLLLPNFYDMTQLYIKAQESVDLPCDLSFHTQSRHLLLGRWNGFPCDFMAVFMSASKATWVHINTSQNVFPVSRCRLVDSLYLCPLLALVVQHRIVVWLFRRSFELKPPGFNFPVQTPSCCSIHKLYPLSANAEAEYETVEHVELLWNHLRINITGIHRRFSVGIQPHGIISTHGYGIWYC